MHANDPLLFRQLQIIQKVIQDETWLEGERRGCPVAPDDRVVRENVCRVILRIGKEMRESALAAIRRESPPAPAVPAGEATAPFAPTHSEAA